MITFSSDEELVEALGSISGDVFRVFVKVDDNLKQDETFSGKHWGYDVFNQFAEIKDRSLKFSVSSVFFCAVKRLLENLLRGRWTFVVSFCLLILWQH